MWQLFQFPLCPFSRKVRLVLAEKGIAAELVRENPWERRDEFVDLNPAGETPVMVDPDQGITLIGSQPIVEYFDETVDRMPMIHGNASLRAEIRRLTEWFDEKLFREVVEPLMNERMRKRLVSKESPDTRILRDAMRVGNNHLDYVDYLLDHRRWLAGPGLSLADFAAAAHLSVIDYLGALDWRGHKQTKDWYAVMKSRPSFRPSARGADGSDRPAPALRQGRLLVRVRSTSDAVALGLPPSSGETRMARSLRFAYRCRSCRAFGSVARAADAGSDPGPADVRKGHHLPDLAGPTARSRAMVAYLESVLRDGGVSADEHREASARAKRSECSSAFRARTANAKPILFSAHMDVVDARPEDWKRDPYKLIEEGDFFYGRGTLDNKAGVVAMTSTHPSASEGRFEAASDIGLCLCRRRRNRTGRGRMEPLARSRPTRG